MISSAVTGAVTARERVETARSLSRTSDKVLCRMIAGDLPADRGVLVELRCISRRVAIEMALADRDLSMVA